VRVAGADVWKGRWVVVLLKDGRFAGAHLCRNVEEVILVAVDAEVIGVDMPIGLPGAGQRRLADVQARRFVGPRGSSVFPTPPQELLACDTCRSANDLARVRGWPGVSAQTFALRSKILEVQPAAERDERLFEVHPEVSFVESNGGTTLAWSKGSWNGQSLRRSLLRGAGIELPDELGEAGTAECPDLLDVAIVAWTSGRIARGSALSLPAQSSRTHAIWR
jgi:predicted RNase H-like nuclease